LTLRELSQTQNMRRRVFLEATKSARDLLNENPTIMDMLEDVKREQVRAGVMACGGDGVCIAQTPHTRRSLCVCVCVCVCVVSRRSSAIATRLM